MKDIIDTMKERIKSPFFGTLIIIWLTFNWDLFIATFIENIAQINKTGSVTRIEYINSILAKKNPNTILFFPIILAGLYQFFLLPFILTSLKNFIFQYSNTLFDSIALKYIFKSKMSIPIERLYEERIQIEKEKDNYRQAIEREKRYRLDYNDLEIKYSELNNQYNKDKENFNLKLNRYNPIHLDGLWKNTWKLPNSTKANSEILRIENGTIYKYKNEAQEIYYGYILNFETDENITSFRFTKNIVNSKLELGQTGHDISKGTFLYNDLKFYQNGTLKGTENGVISINMERINLQDLPRLLKNL